MTEPNGSATHRHRPVTRGFHWLIAALILVQVPLAYYMMGLAMGPDKFGKYALHKSVGMLILGLTLSTAGGLAVSRSPAATATESATDPG